jgi:hypothetical protein
MTTTETTIETTHETLPPVVRTSWCEHGSGHAEADALETSGAGAQSTS